MQQIHSHIYQITLLGFVNVYLITGADGVVVVDAGVSKGTVTSLQKNLAALGLKLADVRHILTTHAHFDHVGGLKTLHEAVPQAKIYASPYERKIVTGEAKIAYPPRSELRGMSWLMSLMLAGQSKPVQVDGLLEEQTDLDFVLPGLKVINLPGHTFGQVGFYLPEAHLLIGGDVMMHLLPRLGLTMPFRAASIDWKACIESIHKVEALNLHTLALGHGPALMGNAAAVVKTLVKKISQREA
ncbi:putative metallo-hydrolase YflN [Anaerolineae bacterium]|nr:putative metallo-hydrolase YflN [Anaerolineae bacterium]